MKGCKKTSGILRYIAAWLCLFAFTLTGCNAKESVNETTTDGQTEINETSSGDTIEDSTYWENADLYTWKPETEGKWGLPEDIDVDDAVFIGDRLCYSEKGFAKLDAGESGAILVYSLTDKKSVELEFSAIEKLINDELGSYSYLYIDKFCEAPNGGLCVLAEVSDVNNNYTSFILTYNFENAELEAMRLSTDMPERNNPMQPSPAQEFAASPDGHYYVRDYNGLNIVDTDGSVTQLSEVNGCVFSYDSSIWYVTYYVDGYGLFRIDEKGSVTERKSGFPSGDVLGSVDGRIFVRGMDGILVYDVEKETADTLFMWTDIDIVSNDVVQVYLVDNSCMAIIYNDRNDETGRTCGIEFVERVSKESVTADNREEIVIGCMYTSGLLERNVVEFNKSQQKYHVSIRTYNDRSNEATTDEAITKLYLDLASGNAPDMLNLQYLDIYNLVDKNAIEDLRPYFDGDTETDIQDYVDSVVEAFTIDGVLTAVPLEYYIYSYFGNADMVGRSAGWTIEDVDACLINNPGSVVSSYWSKEYALGRILAYSVDAFIDSDNGICDFTTDTFDALLDIIGQLPDEVNYSMMGENTSLITDISLQNFESIQQYYVQYGDDIVVKGYPTDDGRECHNIGIKDAYSIVSTSKCKDAAWEFIKFSLENDNSDSSFSPNKNKLQEMVDAELSHAGEEKLSTFFTEQGQFNYHYATQEEIDTVMHMIENVELSVPADSEIITIIEEEIESYFAGSKTKDAAVAIIQDRVQLYLDELE